MPETWREEEILGIRIVANDPTTSLDGFGAVAWLQRASSLPGCESRASLPGAVRGPEPVISKRGRGLLGGPVIRAPAPEGGARRVSARTGCLWSAGRAAVPSRPPGRKRVLPPGRCCSRGWGSGQDSGEPSRCVVPCSRLF